MCDIPVFYATTEGQTRRIADRIAARIREHGLSSEAISLEAPEAMQGEWETAPAIVIGASLHGGRHQKEAARFVRLHRDLLNQSISALFSVSLTAASKRAGEADKARRIAETFAEELGWRPHVVVSLAGRLAYTQYGFLKRWIVRAIARHEGGSTDTTRDFEYTDWAAVGQFADRIVAAVHAGAPRASAPA